MSDDLYEVVLERPHDDGGVIDLTADSPPPRPRPTRTTTTPATRPEPTRQPDRARRSRSSRPLAEPTPAEPDANPHAVIDLTGDDPPPPEPRRPNLGVGVEPEDLDDIIILRSLRHPRAHSRPRPDARPPRPPDRRRLASSFFPALSSYLPPIDVRALFPGLERGFDPLVHLNYQRPAFDPPPPPPPAAAPSVGQKLVVPDAREGFTRDTGEEVVVVCPACGGELEYVPGGEGKKRKREKGEHHFWAVKACGHVSFFPTLFFYHLCLACAWFPCICGLENHKEERAGFLVLK